MTASACEDVGSPEPLHADHGAVNLHSTVEISVGAPLQSYKLNNCMSQVDHVWVYAFKILVHRS